MCTVMDVDLGLDYIHYGAPRDYEPKECPDCRLCFDVDLMPAHQARHKVHQVKSTSKDLWKRLIYLQSNNIPLSTSVPGFLYVVESRSVGVKIGLTRDVSDRLDTAITFAPSLQLERVFFTLNMKEAEENAHRIMANKCRQRVLHQHNWAVSDSAQKSEWFLADTKDACEAARLGAVDASTGALFLMDLRLSRDDLESAAVTKFDTHDLWWVNSAGDGARKGATLALLKRATPLSPDKSKESRPRDIEDDQSAAGDSKRIRTDQPSEPGSQAQEQEQGHTPQ
mmetsp:Transcript_73611/g.172915  ORF Transcript_73611/g.172915 Transcript_73611/m.172915 type:complete len:282 (+) Transcript_73611:365-1210(+)